MSSASQLSVRLSLSPVEKFEAACAVASAKIRADVDAKIDVVERCLSTMTVALRHHIDIFDGDVNARGDLVGTVLAGSDMLMHNAQDLLIYGDYFDRSPEKTAQAQLYEARVAACNAELNAALTPIISNTNAHAIPPFFLQTDAVHDPKKNVMESLKRLATDMAEMLVRHDLRTEMLETMALDTDKLMEAEPTLAKNFKAEAENIRTIQRRYVMRRIEIQTLAERLSPKPFEPFA